MKRIVLCFDGTWNKPSDEGNQVDASTDTNVLRFFRSVAPAGADGTAQVKWYNEGVGTQWYDHVAGGVFAADLDQHIIDGYKQLVQTYEPGDDVYVLGFSRGAYTARSLVGMIRNCGLVKPSVAEWRIGAAYGMYRTRSDAADSIAAQLFRKAFSQAISIKFLGVWDTVGALGIPLQIAQKLNSEFYHFHDTNLSSIVENAYHAMAIDEHRVDYNVSLWTSKAAPAQPVEQRWFCGAHCDVGGGYPDRRLSDIALRWMQDKAEKCGLDIAKVNPGSNNYQGDITDSYTHFLNGVYAQVNPSFTRTVLKSAFGNEVLDESVAQRRGDAGLGYAPTNPGLPGI